MTFFHECISTENLVGIEILTKHRDDIYAIFSNAQSIRFTDNDVQKSETDADELIKKYHDELQQQTSIRWGITQKDSEKIIGITGFYHIDFKHRFATLGSLLNVAFQGRGIMPEMQKATLAWAFQHLNLNRIEAQCFIENDASIKNLENIGFKREGLLRENFLIEGKLESSYLYGLLKHDFNKTH